MSLFDKIGKVERPPEVLQITMYPDPSLKMASKLVVESIPDNEYLQTLIEDMKKTLTYYRAAGLAAIQVGVPLSVILVRDYPDDKIYTLINPIIKQATGQFYENEGCLSVPGVFTRMTRAKDVVVEYLDQAGNKQTLAATGLLARAVLHEIDHLDGITFFERMNFVQRASALKKYKLIKRKMHNGN